MRVQSSNRNYDKEQKSDLKSKRKDFQTNYTIITSPTIDIRRSRRSVRIISHSSSVKLRLEQLVSTIAWGRGASTRHHYKSIRTYDFKMNKITTTTTTFTN